MYRLRTFGGFSIERDGATLDGMRVHRKAHALLAVLAADGSAGRDTLMALLWPESDFEHAKGSLKQAIHLLRRELGTPDAILGTAELRLNPERVESDVARFLHALPLDPELAVRIYTGPFLDGVHLDRTSEFEHWVEARRSALARQYLGVLEQLALTADAQADYVRAAEWWRLMQAADPVNSRVALNLMLALDASGDRAAALRHARVHEALVVQEWGITPDPAVAELAERLRATRPVQVPPLRGDSARQMARQVDAIAAHGGTPSPADASHEAARPAPEGRAQSRWRSGQVFADPWPWRTLAAGMAFGILLLAGAYALVRMQARTEALDVPPVLAVAGFAAHGGTAATDASAAAADMLATNLARVPGLQVVSSARMLEVLAQLGDTRESRAAAADAARRIGANALLEGTLHATPDGVLRLDLRRVDLRTGAVRAAYVVHGSDVFQLVDRATVDVAAGFGATAAGLRLADASTPSLVAYRFYEEGLRSVAAADYRTAERLFDAALAEDSLFAMAAHYLWSSRAMLHEHASVETRQRLVELAERATDRERLLMRAIWSAHDRLAYAETLAVRYPAELDGHLLLASGRLDAGDYLGAIPQLQRVIAIDSPGLRGNRPRCHACSAYSSIIYAYVNADSPAAAERVARDWLRHQPRSAASWAALATTLDVQGREEEALAARRMAASINPIDHSDAIFPARVRIRSGDFATADGLLGDLVRDGTPAIQGEARWWLTISLRNQGRLREALAALPSVPADTLPAAAYPVVLHEGQVLFEQGRFAEAARAFHAASLLIPARTSVGDEARLRSWALTHHAAATAAAGDTRQLVALVDTIERWGRHSTLGRDRRMHHHARGLLLLAEGRAGQAVNEFRRALGSPTAGYTRTNLELARALLAAGRPHEAVAILQPALRGDLESSNLYVTHTELHELLGHAWVAAGRADSAAAHYRRVLDAWRNADPVLHARRDSVRARLAALPSRRAQR